MDCREFRELLGDEIDGRLAPADAARLAAHVASCAACAEERRDLASLRAAFRAMPRPQVPGGFRAQVMDRLPSGRVIRFPRALGWLVAVAAVAVIAVTIFHRGRAGGPEYEVANVPAASARGTYDDDKEGFARKAANSKSVDVAKESADEVLVAQEAAVEEKKKAPGTLNDRADAGAKLRRDDESAAAPPAARAPADTSRAPAPPEPQPPSPFAARANAETVRYVVFRDDASARRFAASLAEPAPEGGKDKDAAAAAPAAKAAENTAARSEAGWEEADRRARDLVEEASFTERRVIARTVVPSSMTERDVDAALAAAGGRAVQAADTERFVALLDTPADAEAAKPKPSAKPDERVPSDPAPQGATAATAPAAPKADGAAEGRGKGTPDTGGGGGGGGGPGGGSGGGSGGDSAGAVKAERESAETRTRQQSRRVVVIVVLGPAPAPAPGGGK